MRPSARVVAGKGAVKLHSYIILLSVIMPQIYDGAQPPTFLGVGSVICIAFSNLDLEILPLRSLKIIWSSLIV